jgi:hypothetical protein
MDFSEASSARVPIESPPRICDFSIAPKCASMEINPDHIRPRSTEDFVGRFAKKGSA